MNILSIRAISIDGLRALTMFLMIFVNDVAGVGNIPDWLKHSRADFDGMGFSDLIFPVFLFIVGLSLPLGLGNKMQRGKSTLSILRYVCGRSLALIVMGFFHVNLENYDHQSAFLAYPVYSLLLTASFFLIWTDNSSGRMTSNVQLMLISGGVVLLIFLTFLYRGGTPVHPIGLRPQWWGILGIIGWAYLVSSLIFLIIQGKFSLLFLAFLAFALINVGAHLGLLDFYVPVIGNASSIVPVLAGACISLLYVNFTAQQKWKHMWFLFSFYGLLAIAFGMFIRSYTGGISKIYGTPSWVFICLGVSILTFEAMVWLMDVKGKSAWLKPIKSAGTSTLTCYLIPYLLYAALNLMKLEFPDYLNNGLLGICRSFVIAVAVIGIVSVMEKNKLRLKI
ncbi:DUF5009 domain-containing protein [Pedobacter agri]|uniref:DUF5009 domain-containing protein n=1 Tax=Pedobacter agri TaxID=454586 RepID=UPI00292F8B55|nr:DUF5009 domain-containing protein [Pedobacter agri]